MSRPVLSFRAFDQRFEILGLKENDVVTKLAKIIYLGGGHTMGRDAGGAYYSTGVGRNRSLCSDAKSAVPYLEGIARLGGLKRANVAKLKAKRIAEEKRDAKAWRAQSILDYLAEIEMTRQLISVCNSKSWLQISRN